MGTGENMYLYWYASYLGKRNIVANGCISGVGNILNLNDIRKQIKTNEQLMGWEKENPRKSLQIEIHIEL
jgi:hypothetical protein